MSTLRPLMLFLTLPFTAIPLTSQTKAQPRGWTVKSKVDQFTGEQTREVTLTVPANFEDRPGRARITATCGNARNTNGPFLTLEVSYHSEAQKDLGFETSGLDATVLPDFQSAMQLGFQTYINALSDPQAMYDKEIHAVRNTPVVRFRVKIDDQSTVGYSRSNYSNVVSINFFDGWSRENVLSPPYGTNQLPPAASLSVGLAAKHIIVELPVANADRPVVEIDLKDRVFRDYASHCPAGSGSSDSDSNANAGLAADGYALRVGKEYVQATFDTAAGFAQAFPNYLKTALEGSKLRSEDYAEETGFIVKAILACGSLTPEVAAGFYQDSASLAPGVSERLKACPSGDSIDVTAKVHGYTPHKKRGILILITPDDGYGFHKWGLGHRFTVKVEFASLSGDTAPNSSQGVNQNSYLIAKGLLEENSVGPGGSIPPRNHLQDARNHMGLRQYDAALADYKLTLIDKPDNTEAKTGVDAIQNLPRTRAAFVSGLGANGLWLDPQTNLLWTLADSDKDLYQSESYLYCANLKADGLSGWRLPVLPEVQAIYDPRISASYRIKGNIKLNGRGGWIWTQGVETTQGQNLRFFSFQTGAVHDEFAYNYANFRARAICVRPYQPDQDGIPFPLVAPASAAASASQPTPFGANMPANDLLHNAF
jgi:hypothetical protein